MRRAVASKNKYLVTETLKSFSSDETNQVFCETFMKHALRDPISNEIGKTIAFCVSQDHALRITQTLNVLRIKYSRQYNSDFAVQVTSFITGAQQYTKNFANNNLNGQTRWLEAYKSSKTRVCVTVGMMTTGYDCQDIQNLCLIRPIFSPSDFVQIKGEELEHSPYIRKKMILVTLRLIK